MDPAPRKTNKTCGKTNTSPLRFGFVFSRLVVRGIPRRSAIIRTKCGETYSQVLKIAKASSFFCFKQENNDKPLLCILPCTSVGPVRACESNNIQSYSAFLAWFN